jgi:acetyl-CoA carboxylase carboxyl transferase subunit alpha
MNEEIIQELKRKISELKKLGMRDGVDLDSEISRLEAKLTSLKRSLEDDWEVVKLARHPKRPSALDYINLIMDDFYELHGDRLLGDDPAVVGGLAKFGGKTVVVIGQHKSKERNFGMPHPEGYRKALRIMKLGERFGFAVISLVDTPGAYPGKGAEERNIGGALAQNIYEMLQLEVPILVAIIGEGGSGGALGVGVGDRVLMLENAIYSVISPEGCAAILWRDKEKAPQAASALKMRAKHLLEFGAIDEIVKEPLGGAHKNHQKAASLLKEAISRHLKELKSYDINTLLKLRHQRYQSIGVYASAEVVE